MLPDLLLYTVEHVPIFQFLLVHVYFHDIVKKLLCMLTNQSQYFHVPMFQFWLLF